MFQVLSEFAELEKDKNDGKRIKLQSTSFGQIYASFLTWQEIDSLKICLIGLGNFSLCKNAVNKNNFLHYYMT